ncbi:SDR family oxidoreductase [Spirosoma panaciterrae]|uniref:SDR family oxidoreductase n=1 Tax=Spirosoma panaciterrae TaxID=496058 RepID=UPI0003731931|nr:SDR family oxidoreductase [Spirosoma panaciterrae]
MMIRYKTILVTGGAGFIGSNLCEALLAKDNKVICLDNFSIGKRENIDGFLNHPDFSLIEGDIRNLADCRNAVKGVDFVLHQAALGSVPRSIADPIATNSVNVTGFLNMLVAAKDAGAKRFVYACSSSTYGDSTVMPKREDVIGKPLSPYAVTKYVNELYADVFHKTYGFNTIGLRYFNVFGKRQDPNGPYAAVIPKFITQLMKYEAPVINGDGEHSRDFTYVANVVQANLLALTCEQESLNTIYNIAYGGRITLNELVRHLKNQLADYDAAIANIGVIHGSNRLGDIPHSFASIEKAKRNLHYEPAYTVEAGLKQTVEWYWQQQSKLVEAGKGVL